MGVPSGAPMIKNVIASEAWQSCAVNQVNSVGAYLQVRPKKAKIG